MECKLLENQVYVATNGEYRFCCESQEVNTGETVHKLTPQEWLTSSPIKTAKEQLKEGNWPDACISCKRKEEAGLQSRRLERHHYGPGISHLDLRFGNSCNLKCISCWSGSSSSINEEAIQMKIDGIDPLHPIFPQSVANWYDEKFFSYFENLPVKEIAFAGGEPFMIKHLPEFLERIDPSVIIRFTTNATITNPKVIKILKKFPKIVMTLSLDAIGKRIEYIRHGSKWADIERNANIFAEFCKVDISPCISVLNAAYYDEIKDWASSQQFKIYENLLRDPDYLHVKNAPDSLKSQFKYIDSWKNYPADILKQEEFRYNIRKLDSFRNIKIKDYLPEVAAAYGID